MDKESKTPVYVPDEHITPHPTKPIKLPKTPVYVPDKHITPDSTNLQNPSETIYNYFNQKELEYIKFGSWQTDANQIFNENIPKKLFEPTIRKKLFESIKLYAEAKFGKAISDLMTQESLGIYQPEQHFDNPSKPDQLPEQTAIPSYITKGINKVKKTIEDTIKFGNTHEGLVSYGGTLHIIEDFFAHSNFVEIACILENISIEKNIPKEIVIAKNKKRYRLESGICGIDDTFLCILNMIAEEKKKPQETGFSTGQKILIIFLEKYCNKTVSELGAMFISLSNDLDDLLFFLEPIKNELNKKIAKGLKIIQDFLAKLTGTEWQSSHSNLNKDDDSKPLHNIAKAFSDYAVSQFSFHMKKVWSKEENKEELLKLVDKFLSHPDESDWWKEILKRIRTESHLV